MQMQRSKVLEKLRAGEFVGCVKMNLADPRVADIAGLVGLECLWLGMEHTPNTLEQIEHCIRAAKMHDMDTLVRVERGSYSDLVRPLEMDATGIMVPHVMSAADARAIVRQTRFHPIGRRPIDGGNSDGAYCMIPVADYLRQANEQRFLVLQIEDPETMDELDEIAGLEGVDMLFFGPGDYSHGLGIPGQMDDPRIDQARRAVADAARRHGKYAGTTGRLKGLDHLREIGYQFVALGADVLALTDYFGRIAEGLGLSSNGNSTANPRL
jgi:4-hydroxy-2-oxoheptanedioate aldolase